MIKISILYPNKPDSFFNLDYYIKIHMPMSINLLSQHDGFKGVTVEHVLDTNIDGVQSAYIAMCHFSFVSISDFLAAFSPNAEILQRDMANYTNIEPIIQFNEVLISI